MTNTAPFQWLEPRNDWPFGPTAKPPTRTIDYWRHRGAHEQLAPLIGLFLRRLHILGHSPMICQLHRTPEQQAALYAQGRTTPGRIVTDAQPWQSAHCVTINGEPAAMAFDICMLVGNKASWEMSAATAQFWSDARDTGNMLGLVWGATFNKPPRDFGHFQLSTFKAIKP